MIHVLNINAYRAISSCSQIRLWSFAPNQRSQFQMSQSGVREWLRQVMRAYQSPDRSISDIEQVLHEHPGLGPKTDLYTQDDGRQLVLLCISGTIPIVFNGSVYNIPIALWLPPTYPSQPPFAHVLPTPTMVVKPSKHVDISGRIYHPFLAYWHLRPTSTIPQFVRVLIEIFSVEPPVYAKPSAASPNSGSMAMSISGESPLNNGSPSFLSPSSNSPSTRPVSFHSIPGAFPQSQPSSQPHGYGQQTSSGVYSSSPSSTHGYFVPHNGSPVIPPKRPAVTQSNTPQSQLAPYQYTMSSSTSHSSTLSSNAQAHSLSQPNTTPMVLQPPTDTSGGPTTLNAPSLAHRMSFPPFGPSGLTQQPLKPSFTGHVVPDAAARELHSRRTLLRSKLTERLTQIDQSISYDIERLLGLSKTLTENEHRVLTSMDLLRDVERKLQENCRVLQAQILGVETRLGELKSMPDIEVDTYLVGKTVMENQAFELVAGDHALDDVIYHLTQGFGGPNRSVDLTGYLKSVRLLAREQFMKRALFKKVMAQIARYQTV
ncbi:hypothetical protein BASA50_009844 [Batrachochytrium salamandrivorans]|uniref:UEV domain-containing protein n=1 Tax=Batrachochytrium salamandrivorans TaxID=1357716 RepID=A0ABQ8F084_9FUNG|nr:hypothetical protein BASA50_009844 [Batrachochytrium salamandrivorans]